MLSYSMFNLSVHADSAVLAYINFGSTLYHYAWTDTCSLDCMDAQLTVSCVTHLSCHEIMCTRMYCT